MKIDGQTTDQMTPDEVSIKIRGPAGTKVALTLGRKDVKDPIELTITRMDVNVASVTSKMYDQIAYIRITQFILPTTDDFQKALQSSLDKGAKGIILDLRDNPGGILDQAVDVASEFLLRGIVVKVVDKDGKETVFRVKPGGLALNVPLIVLVNGNSASASEIVAGALQDNGRAKLAGTQTYGKASVQNIIRLEDGGAIKVTVPTTTRLMMFCTLALPKVCRCRQLGTVSCSAPATISLAWGWATDCRAHREECSGQAFRPDLNAVPLLWRSF